MLLYYDSGLGLVSIADCIVTVLAIAVAIFVYLMPIYQKPAKALCCILAVACFYMCLFFRAAGAPIEWHALTTIATGLTFALQFGICYLTYQVLVPQ